MNDELMRMVRTPGAVLAIMIGISGSGKTTIAREIEGRGFKRICPDDIRLEFTGNISDQSQNGRVWKEAHERLRETIASGVPVVFDSIGTTRKTRRQLQEIAAEFDVPTYAVCLEESYDEQLCRSRVAADLSNGVTRSNTLVNEDIISRQHNKFVETMKSIDTEGFTAVVRVR